MLNRQVMLNEMEKPERNLWVIGSSITEFLHEKVNKVFDDLENRCCNNCKYACKINDDYIDCSQGIVNINHNAYVDPKFCCSYYHRF